MRGRRRTTTRVADRRGVGAVDPDPHQLALGVGDLLSLSPSRVSGAPQRTSQPRYVANEPSRPKPSAPGRCEAAKAVRCRRSTTHSPRVDPPPQLDRLGQVRRRQVGRVGPGGVAGRHVGVVGRVGGEPVEQLAGPGLGVLGEHRVAAPLAADRRAGRRGLGRRAEAAEAVGREQRRVVGQLVGQAVRRGVLVVGELVRVLGSEQVGASGRAVQQRPAAEGRDLGPGAGVGEGVGQVVKVWPGVASAVTRMRCPPRRRRRRRRACARRRRRRPR